MTTCNILDNERCPWDSIDCVGCKILEMHSELELYRKLGEINDVIDSTEKKLDDAEKILAELPNVQLAKSLSVGQVVSACEYINCDIVDALGQKIIATAEELYDRSVEHIESDKTIRIYTFDNINKLGVE